MNVSGKKAETNSCARNKFSENYELIDYKDWSVGFSRKNNAFNLYLTLRMFGIRKYKHFFRRALHMAEILERLLLNDKDIKIITKRELGVICFRFIS